MPFLPLHRLIAIAVLSLLALGLTYFLIERLIPVPPPPPSEDVSAAPSDALYAGKLPPVESRPHGGIHAA